MVKKFYWLVCDTNVERLESKRITNNVYIIKIHVNYERHSKITLFVFHFWLSFNDLLKFFHRKNIHGKGKYLK